MGTLVYREDPWLSWLLCSALAAADVLVYYEILWCGWLQDPASTALGALVCVGWLPRLGHWFGGALGSPEATFQVLEGGMLLSRGSEATRTYLLGAGGRVAPLEGLQECHVGRS